MTEAEVLDTYIDQTCQIDRSDPANAARVSDITGAWMYRARMAEAPPMPTGWRQTVVQVMQRLDLGAPESPTQAASAIVSALGTLQDAIAQANQQVQGLAMRDEIITNQGKVLDGFAAVLELPNGSLYSDMIPVLQQMKEDITRALSHPQPPTSH